MTTGGFEVVRAIIDDNEEARQDENARVLAEGTTDHASPDAQREGIPGHMWRACK